MPFTISGPAHCSRSASRRRNASRRSVNAAGRSSMGEWPQSGSVWNSHRGSWRAARSHACGGVARSSAPHTMSTGHATLASAARASYARAALRVRRAVAQCRRSDRSAYVRSSIAGLTRRRSWNRRSARASTHSRVTFRGGPRPISPSSSPGAPLNTRAAPSPAPPTRAVLRIAVLNQFLRAHSKPFPPLISQRRGSESLPR